MEHLGLQLLDLQQTMNQNSNNEFKETDDAASKTLSTDQGLLVQNWVKLTFGGGSGACALYFSDTIM